MSRRKMRLTATTGIMLTLLLIGVLTLAFNVQLVTANETIELYYDNGEVVYGTAAQANGSFAWGVRFDLPEPGTAYVIQSAKIHIYLDNDPLRLFVYLYNTSVLHYEKVCEKITSTLTPGWNIIDLTSQNIVTDQEFVVGVNWVVDSSPVLGGASGGENHGVTVRGVDDRYAHLDHTGANTMIRAYVYVYAPVGGIWVPVDKLGLLAPYIGLASTIPVATAATAIYVKRVKHLKKK